MNKFTESNCKSLASFTKLTKLETLHSFMTEHFPQIERLPLKELRVPSDQSDAFWQKVLRVTTIDTLALGTTGSKSETSALIVPLTKLQNLTKLEVYSWHKDYKSFLHLTNLQELVTRPHRFSESELKKIKEKLPYLYSV